MKNTHKDHRRCHYSFPEADASVLLYLSLSLKLESLVLKSLSWRIWKMRRLPHVQSGAFTKLCSPSLSLEEEKAVGSWWYTYSSSWHLLIGPHQCCTLSLSLWYCLQLSHVCSLPFTDLWGDNHSHIHCASSPELFLAFNLICISGNSERIREEVSWSPLYRWSIGVKTRKI